MNICTETLNQLGGQLSGFIWAMLWQSSLLIVLVFALDFLLARKIRASVRYALWLAVLVKLLLPPTLALPTGASWWLFQSKPAVNVAAAGNYVVTYGATLPQSAFIPQTIPMPPSAPPKLDGAGWMLLASGVVSAGLLLWLALRWWQVDRMVRRATVSTEFSETIEEARRLAGCGFRVRLKLIERRMSPAVCGLVRPVILLPRTLAEKLSVPQLRAVLLHEIFHLRRRDVWVNCAQAMLQIIYWWHPLLWIANARIRRLREEAVDDAVMLALREEADSYAPTLLEVAKLAFRRPLLSLGLVGIMESRSALRQRIERLVDFRTPRKAGLTFASLCGIFAFSAVALPMGQASAPAEKQAAATLAAPTQPVVRQTTNRVPILVEAQIYEMRAADFKDLVSGLQFEQAVKGGDVWWSASKEGFSTLQASLKKANFNLLTRPRIQTASGMPAEFYCGNGTNGIWFDCMPTVAGNIINLTIDGKVIDGGQQVISTNQFRASTSAENDGGMVVRIENLAGLETSNLVAVIGVEIITNAPYSVQRLHPDAVGWIKSLSASDAEQVQGLVQDAKVEYETGKIDMAKEKLELAMAINPDNVVARYYLGLVDSSLVLRQSGISGQSAAGRRKIVDKLNNIRLDQFGPFMGMPLEKILGKLTEASKRADPEKTGINFLVTSVLGDQPADVNSVIINIPSASKNVSLDDALEAVALGASKPVKYYILDDGNVFLGVDKQKLFTRTFRVSADVFTANLRQQVNLHVASNADVWAAARMFFSKLGVDMDWPKGKSVFYNDRLAMLFVKATEPDLDKIEAALMASLQTAPQIHIKARFLEVPMGTMADFGHLLVATNSTVNQFTGILNSTNTKTALRALESRNAVEMLAEPEGIALNGRQMQMRATQVITVVTNFEFGTNGDSAIVPQTTQVETGPVLDVIPYVLSDGYTINLTVIPSLTEFLGYASPPDVPNVTGTKNRVQRLVVLPQFSTRQMTANLNLWDGQTVVIGGMTKVNHSAHKVPVLGDVSLVGRLFDDRRDIVTTNEVLVLITATIVDSAGKRVHADDAMPFAGNTIPPQPPQ